MSRQRTIPPRALALALTLGGSLLYAILALTLIPAFLPQAAENARTNFLPGPVAAPSLAPGYVLAGVWERFDTLWYLEIASHGYREPAAVVFYPLYPLLIRLLSLTGIAPLVAAVLVTRMAAFLFLWGLAELFRLDLDEAAARRALLLLLAWPGAFILFAAYPEPLAGAAAAWALVAARRERWRTAAALAIAACLSKAAGAAVLAPLVVLAWPRWRARLAPLGAAAAGAVAYPAWLWAAGHLLPNAAYPRYWATTAAPPWETLAAAVAALARGGDWLLALNLGGLLLLGAAAAARRLRLEYAIYVAVCYLLFFTKQTRPLLQSSLRYALAAFPAFASAAALLGRPPVYGGVLLVLTLMNILGVFAFWNWSLLF